MLIKLPRAYLNMNKKQAKKGIVANILLKLTCFYKNVDLFNLFYLSFC